MQLKRLKKTKTISFLKNSLFVCLMPFFGLYFGFRNVSAAVDVLPWPSPTASPTKRPPTLQPIAVQRPTRPMWMGQGELLAHDDEFVCRVRCERSWVGFDIEVLQATRGAEDWTSFEGERIRCQEEGENSGRWYLHAGRWSTASHLPEDTLCFLVLTGSRHVP